MTDPIEKHAESSGVSAMNESRRGQVERELKDAKRKLAELQQSLAQLEAINNRTPQQEGAFMIAENAAGAQVAIVDRLKDQLAQMS